MDEFSNLDMYADGPNFHTGAHLIKDLHITLLSRDLQNIHNWCSVNEMVVNLEKKKNKQTNKQTNKQVHA